MLRPDETLFKNPDALGFEFMPKLIKHREKEQFQIRNCIRPLMHDRDGRNVFFFGPPGIGKTLAVRHVLDSIDDPDDDQYGDVSDKTYPLYVNCWTYNTSFKIIEKLCHEVGFKFTQNKKTDELYKALANVVNRKAAVFAFDEIDKCQDFDFLYTLIEQIFKKSIILITNHKEFILGLEDRVKSRLAPDMLEFKQYTMNETRDILEQRKEYAFVSGTWDNEAFMAVVQATCQAGDIRAGLHMMKEAGENAEAESQRKITLDHAKKAIEKIGQMSIRSSDELDEEARFILKIIKASSEGKIGDLYKSYQEQGGKSSYKTFQRKVQRLDEGKYVTTKKVTGGTDGSTTIVSYLRTKKLTDF